MELLNSTIARDWQTLACFLSSAVFVLVVVCPVSLGCDFSNTATLFALLFCNLLSQTWITGANKPPQSTNTILGKPKKEEVPVVLERAKKKPLKEKRKRKKSADKDNKDSLKVATPRNSVHTRMYSTLLLYEDVRRRYSLDDSDLYKEFGAYLLTPQQLSCNGFPLECPENPGRIISRCKVFPADPSSRKCSRCFKTFQIVADKHISDTNCIYHPDRCEDGLFTCCNSGFGARGCSVSLHHVTSVLNLDNIQFRRTDGKRHVREDQFNKVYALDCEMVFTTIGMEVAKVGLVDLEGKTVYQTFVKPAHPILDYNTKFSGITKWDLEGINITLEDVQTYLLKTLNKNTILVGHALQNDLRVLRLIHEKIVDTQVVFHEGTYKKKLKFLAKEYLDKSIQDSEAGHDSIEDARACIELMLWKVNHDLAKQATQQEKLNSSTKDSFHTDITVLEDLYFGRQVKRSSFNLNCIEFIPKNCHLFKRGLSEPMCP